MLRYLPLLMVALGLLLVSTSFAHARTAAGVRAEPGAICLVPEDAVDAEDHKLGRCWKKMGLGILVAGCKAHAELPRHDFAFRPRPAPCWPPLIDPVLIDGPAPPLDIPPPKA